MLRKIKFWIKERTRKIKADALIRHSRVFFLDCYKGNDGNDGLSKASAFKTLVHVYSKIESERYDVIKIISKGSLEIPVGFVWDKNKTALKGMPGKRTKIDGVLNITADNSIFYDLRWEVYL